MCDDGLLVVVVAKGASLPDMAEIIPLWDAIYKLQPPLEHNKESFSGLAKLPLPPELLPWEYISKGNFSAHKVFPNSIRTNDVV